MTQHELQGANNDLTPIRESVRALCADFPGEYWRRLDRERAYPDEFVAALTKAGFLAALIPEEYGGSGLTMTAAAAIMEEIQASGCNGAACHAQMYTMGTLLRHGSSEQKKRYLPGIARGELRLQAFGVTEPTSGTDTLNLRTTAVRDGDTYVVNGQKIWTSRAEHSDLMLLLARTTPRAELKSRTAGLTVFLVDMRQARGHGLTIRPIRTMMNHATTEVFIENLRVPADAVIGKEGEGFRYILSGMNAERILIAAECVGDTKWFIEKATAYAGERVVFGRPIGQNQGVQFPIARAYIGMRAAELMVREAAPKPIWQSISPPKRPGPPPTCAYRLTAASALPRNSTSSANFARPGSIPWRRSRPIWCCPISPSMCSACRVRIEYDAPPFRPPRRVARTGGGGADV
jgi:alkylation response protein AidB-like acyl-CoA dehydrogenase